MGNNSEIGSHADPGKESSAIGKPDILARETVLRLKHFFQEMEDDTIKGLLTTQGLPSTSPAKELSKQVLTHHLNGLSDEICDQTSTEDVRIGPSNDNHFKTAASSTGTSCDESGAPECDARINNNINSSAFDSNPTSLSPSTANLPMTQITNSGGTININYNIYTAPVPRPSKAKDPAVDKGEENVHAERDPGLTSPIKPNAEPSNAERSLAKPSRESHAVPRDAAARIGALIAHDERHQFDLSKTMSDIEKAKVKDSIDQMFLESINRLNLSDELMDLARTIRRTKWDEKQCAYVPLQLGIYPSNADPDTTCSKGLTSPSPFPDNLDKTDPAIEEPGSIQAPFTSTPISPMNEASQCDRSGLGIHAPPACQGVSSSQRDVNADDGNKSDFKSIETVVLLKNDTRLSPIASTQNNSGGIVEERTGQSSSEHQGQVEDTKWSPDFATYSPHTSQEAKFGPELNDISAPAAVSPASSPRKPKRKPRRAPIQSHRRGKIGSQEISKEEAIPVSQSDDVFDDSPQDLLAPPQESPFKSKDDPANQNAKANESEQVEGGVMEGGLMKAFKSDGASQVLAGISENTEGINTQPATIGHLTPNRCPLVLPGRMKTAMEASPSNDLGPKMEKRRAKKPAIEAGQCEENTDGPTRSSTSDPAARRAVVLNMLARMAGGPASNPGDAQGTGHRDFTFLMPQASETRKCRLCRNIFTEKSNVKQADGGAPCSFHPGVLEDKTGNNTSYAFSCCGGPPIMVGPNLVAMNLVSPGCTKCFHQDKLSAWNLETMKMKDPVLFEE